MPPFFERYRHLILLLAVLLAQLFYLAFQIKTPGTDSTRLIRVWAMAGLSPVQKTLHWTINGVGDLVQNYVLLYDVRQENLRLQTELEETKIQMQQLEARATEADRLAGLLDLRRTYGAAPLVAAEVIGTAAANVPIIFINRGADKNLKPNMAVITPEGVVGKIITVHPATAEVLLLTHQKSGVGALVTDSRVQGILKGDGTQTMLFAYVPNEEEITVGSLLLTSGQDQVFPKGLPAGKILAASRGSQKSGEYFWSITVEPAARLSRLEQVLILAGPPESFTVAQSPPKL